MPKLFMTSDALYFLLREGEDVLIIYRGKVRRVVGFHGDGSLELEPLPTERAPR